MLARLVAYLRAIAPRGRAERELDEELRFHVEMETRANMRRSALLLGLGSAIALPASLALRWSLAYVLGTAADQGPHLAGAPQQPIDASASVAREVRELRLSLERASAVSTQAIIVALQVSAAQARMTSVDMELANLRAQGGMLAAQVARMRRLVEEFEADFPDPSYDPDAMLRDLGIRSTSAQEHRSA